MVVYKGFFGITAVMSVLCLVLCSGAMAAPVLDWVPPGGYIVFWWTQDGAAITDPEQRDNNTDEGKWENFGEPPAAATDWRQWTEDKNGKRSDVIAGNIKKGSDWEWHVLSELPDVDWRIPDLIAKTPSLTTLYTAINLDLYLSSNPWPALSPGETLSIEAGKLDWLQGIYWSETEFSFDPTSENGFVGLPFTGLATVQNFHTNVPEPATLALFWMGMVALVFYRMHKNHRG